MKKHNRANKQNTDATNKLNRKKTFTPCLFAYPKLIPQSRCSNSGRNSANGKAAIEVLKTHDCNIDKHMRAPPT
jgi:hypothetical protein